MADRRGQTERISQARASATRALALAKRDAQARQARLFEEKVLAARLRAAEFAAARSNAAHPPAPPPAAFRPAASPRRERERAKRSLLPQWLTLQGLFARWLTALLGFGALGLMLGSALPVSSQTRSSKPPRPPVQELLQLIEAARQAGLTEDQIRQLTLQDEEGNSINAWEYLQTRLAQKRKQEALEREERTKVYLTVRDVFADLRKGEARDLDQLREQLPYLK